MTDRPSLTDLERGTPFTERHIGPRPDELATMLAAIGAESLDELADAAVPASIRDSDPVPSTLPPAGTETEVLDALRALAARNTVTVPMIGQGYHGTVTPPAIRRHVLENPAWYTAYTPYQPEISQGRLEALLTFQTTVADLTGLPVAGASLLDEATAAAEAMTLLRRANRATSPRFLVDVDTLPQTRDVLATRAAPLGIELVPFDPADGLPEGEFYGVLLSYPGASGAVRDLRPVIDAAHERGALVAVAADLLALTLLTPPGELGADVAVGTTQRFGVPLGFGGPHAGYLSVRDKLARQLPGRLVGLSHDVDGRPALRLALQTREQHIRREKATSNICTAQVLLAVVAACYAVYHGPDGLARIARARPPHGRRARRGPARAAASRSSTTRSSTPSGRGCRAGPRRSPTPRTQPGSRCTASTPTPWASRAPSSPRWPTWRRCGPRSACTPTPPSSTRARPTRCPPSSRAPATTSRTRSSTSTARRRR